MIAASVASCRWRFLNIRTVSPGLTTKGSSDAARVMVVDFEELDPELERRGSRARGRLPSNLAAEDDSKDAARKSSPLLSENAELDRENLETLEDRAN